MLGNQMGLNSRLHPARNAHGMLARMTPDEVVVADSTQDRPLISYVSSKYLVADRGYGTDANEDLGSCTGNGARDGAEELSHGTTGMRPGPKSAAPSG